MHTSVQLDQAMFDIRIDGDSATREALFPDWEPRDRLGVLIHHPLGAVGASYLIQLAITGFYDVRPDRRTVDGQYPDVTIAASDPRTEENPLQTLEPKRFVELIDEFERMAAAGPPKDAPPIDPRDVELSLEVRERVLKRMDEVAESDRARAIQIRTALASDGIVTESYRRIPLEEALERLSASHEGERQWEFDRKADDPEARKAAAEWAAALSERGWVAPHWPTEYGGGGMTVAEQFVFRQEMAEAAAPTVGGSAVSLLGPTLIVHGTDEQKSKYLPPILAGERVWAQGYSEPGAGSDLASVATRAVRDGDEYVVNGQKIWTSGAHAADSIFALTRTDPDAPKHRGISFLLIDDIHTDGITVRPLVNMNDKHYFNETFFEDVRVPATNLVGEENRGWYVGMTLLDFERSNISGAVGARRTLSALIDHATSGEAPAMRQLGAGSRRTDLAERWIETEVMFQYSFRIVSMQQAGLIPNYEASTAKLFNSELVQRLALTGTRVFGLHANNGDETTLAGEFARAYLAAVPATIRGGTSEVQRNIIATRGLGLPRG